MTNYLVNNGTNIMVEVGSHSWNAESPIGAFMVGFLIVLSVWMTGWCLRQVKWVGHFGGGE